MPNLPLATDFTGSAVTEAGFKTAIAAMRDFLALLLGTSGTQAAALAAIGSPLNGVVAKTATYTLAAADRGKLFDATSGTWTFNLIAAATAGDGFVFAVRNSGSGVITIDPNSTETIDGAATITLSAGESCLCVCNGTAWKTVSKAAALTSAAIVAALTYTPSPNTHNHAGAYVGVDNASTNIGSIITGSIVHYGYAISTDGLYAGSSIYASSMTDGGIAAGGGGALPGTWRALGYAPNLGGYSASVMNFQRVA